MKSIVKNAVKNLRNNCTESEKILWDAVRNRKLKNKKFYRQYPITFNIEGKQKFFIADFCCFEEKLIVEIDGGIHEKKKEYDALRNHIINHLGMRVVRFRNKDIEQNLNNVLSKLEEYL